MSRTHTNEDRAQKILILGGVRSGKTAYGMECVKKFWSLKESASELVYLATAEAFDEGMQLRIARHQEERLQDKTLTWRLIEEPKEIVGILKKLSPLDVVLVDCLSIWLNNLLIDDRERLSMRDMETHLEREINRLVDELLASPLHVVLVSSEVGLGFLPLHQDARLFGDMLGILHQRIAKIVDEVVFVVAGLPLKMKEHELK